MLSTRSKTRTQSGLVLWLVVIQFGCVNNLPTMTSVKRSPAIIFSDVTQQAGLNSKKNWKYGGPAIADLNNDGRYDLLLTNHNSTAAQLFLAMPDNTFMEVVGQFPQADLHGITAGDYDLDGDNDVVLSVGGGNGLTPQPQRLFRNDDGIFVEVTQDVGISKMGARGRSVRWIDLDTDGDLDFLQINAPKVVNENMPRNILFKNNGNGLFEYVSSPLFEEIDAERVLLSDFSGDGVLDLLAFDGHGETFLLQSHNDFTFSDVTDSWLPKSTNNYKHVIAVAHADIDLDGDLDYYLARGMLHYGLADNSVYYNRTKKQLDIRDEGNTSEDGMELSVEGDLTLLNFYHWPRGKKLEYMPVYFGKSKLKMAPPNDTYLVQRERAAGFPEQLDDTGWYIGYLGDGKWKVRWKLVDNPAWGIRASFLGVTSYETDFKINNPNLPDVLLRNDGDGFTDISHTLPDVTKHNNWGVAVGDFDNDGDDDFFIHRFGELKERVYDVVLVNDGTGKFEGSLATSATTGVGKDQHGDMGVAFDYNLDGKIDLLNGDDDNGPWYLYKNVSQHNNHYVIVHVGYSATGVDPYGASIIVVTKGLQQRKIVGSLNASHSQSLLNIAHFGLARASQIEHVTVTWRDGSQQILKSPSINAIHKVGQ
ncbi:MAG: hypothetical protein Alis3KO_28860 [Aliiglaciecola sp.]